MNRALRIFAGGRVISPDDSTKEAAHCKAAWDEARDAALAAYPWGFATRWARLARSADAPAFGFTHAYALPADFLYLIDIRSEADLTAPPERHCISVGTNNTPAVFTDAEQAFARYVFRHAQCALWPEHFCELFAARLAAAVAPYLTQDAGIGVTLRELYRRELALASAADARQDFAPEVREMCNYIDTRRG